MEIIGHRGAPTEALENSLESFEKAKEAGASIVELDAWCAKDGSFWVSHDESLERTCGIKEKISLLMSKDLEKIQLRNGEPLPSLEKALTQLTPFLRVNVELKDKSQKEGKLFFDFISRTSFKERVIVSCFHLEPLEILESLDSKIQLALLWEENNSYAGSPLSYLKDHKNWFFHPQADIMTYEMISKLHEEERVIYPWVSRFGVEDKSRENFWEVMLSMKVHGLCTNYPRELSSWLKKKRG